MLGRHSFSGGGSHPSCLSRPSCTRRSIVKAGAGLAAIIAAGKAPAALIRSALAARNAMMAETGPFKKTWDYRVAYFQNTATYSNTGYFMLPSASMLNPATAESVQSAVSAFFDAPFHRKMTIGFSSSANVSLDLKFFGAFRWFAACTYSNKWRPTGSPAGWMYQPTSSQFPIVKGTAAEFDFYSISGTEPSAGTLAWGYTAKSSEGRTYDYSSTSTKPTSWSAPKPTQFRMPVFGFYGHDHSTDGPPAFVDIRTAGLRFFQASVEHVHPTLGLRAFWIPVVKNDQPYVADAYTGTLYPRLGGDNIAVGPMVEDAWDPLTWSE